MRRIKNTIKKILLVDEGPKPLFERNKIIPKKKIKNEKFIVNEFGSLNENKTFYVIRRRSHAGIFSYLTFVLNHLIIAKENNFIPVVDMQNFVSPYNEKHKIENTLNSWEYYFEQTSKYKLDEVYNSKNVILSEDFFHAKMSYQIHLNKSFNEFKGKNIFIKPKYIDFVKNYFEEKKLIGK